MAATTGGWHLAAVNRRAAALGLCAGELLADARARVPALQTRNHAPEKDRAALTRLARWSTRFSPYVAPWPEEDSGGGAAGLTFDIDGCAHLFGGEEKMMARVAAALAKLGFTAHLGIADTIGGSHALARFGGGRARPGAQYEAIAPLPVEALRLSPATAAGLKHLGLKTVGALLPLPRAPLTARFGAGLVERIDQALGRVREAFSPLLPHAPYRAHTALAEPIFSQDHVLKLAHRLACDLAPVLERDGKGARALTLTLYRVDGETAEMTVRLASASRDADHIVKLFSLKLEALHRDYDAGFGFEAARLDVILADAMAARQESLAPDLKRERAEKISILVDRLGSRLGLANVTRARACDTHIPERAMTLQAATAPAPDWEEDAGPRPLFLLPAAEPADVTALLPEGPPLQFRWRGVRYSIALAEGPERVRPEWWREKNGKTRDYYTVEDDGGRRFWLYRDGPYGQGAPPKWFVHGVYA